MTKMPGFTAEASLFKSMGTYAGRGARAPEAHAVRPAENACTEEGFFPSPDDCTRFYRCVNLDGSFTKFDFMCGPGTMYHPELVTCVHPWQMPPGPCNPG